LTPVLALLWRIRDIVDALYKSMILTYDVYRPFSGIAVVSMSTYVFTVSN